jgi:hypothetical protein
MSNFASKRRSAGLFSKGERLFIYPAFWTTAGLSIGGEPVEVLDRSAQTSEIGRALLDALANNREGIPHPATADAFNDLPQPVLEAAGTMTWALFSRGALSLWIAEEGSTLVFIPTRKIGSKSAYRDVPDAQVIVGLPATADQIGAAAREALARCQ